MRPFASITAVLLLLVTATADAAPIVVTVDTAPLNGTSALLAFDFIDGGDGPSNNVSITAFTTNGTLGAAQTVGDVTGGLPGSLTLGDNDLFNEYLRQITLGTSFSFTLNATGNAPTGGNPPDAFSFFLLDGTTFLPLFATSDLTGADALVLFEITGVAGTATTFRAPGGEASISLSTGTQVPVPEPGTLALTLLGIGGAVARRWRRDDRVS